MQEFHVVDTDSEFAFEFYMINAFKTQSSYLNPPERGKEGERDETTIYFVFTLKTISPLK